MKIALLGNFNVSFSTESHYALTLESMGHEVVRLQEGQTTEFDLWHKVVKCDLFVWIKTHGWHQWGVEKVVATCKKRGIPTMTYHLDLWMGLGRERDMLRGPYWNLDHFFTVDALMADHLNKHSTVQGHYLPAGVFGDECYMKQGDPTKHPVVFVGSKGYHREHPYRGQLIDWLHETYGDDFHHYGGDGKGTIRGDALNQLYADSAVVVGDSLCKDFTYANYWSDRIYETTGRGGFLIHPHIDGIENEFTNDRHVVFYDFGDFEGLKRRIDYFLEHPVEREQIRLAGHEHTKKNHTYANRWDEILKTVTK